MNSVVPTAHNVGQSSLPGVENEGTTDLIVECVVGSDAQRDLAGLSHDPFGIVQIHAQHRHARICACDSHIQKNSRVYS